MTVLCAPAALAQGPSAVNPHPSSPSGKVYEIPLDTARGDAAPRRGGGGSPGREPAGGGSTGSTGPAGGGPGSGSDATLGGGEGSGAGEGSGPGASGSEARDGGDPPTSIKSENGFGSSSRVPGLGTRGAGETGTPTTPAASGGVPSEPATIGLLGLIGLLGGYVGVRAGRRRLH